MISQSSILLLVSIIHLFKVGFLKGVLDEKRCQNGPYLYDASCPNFELGIGSALVILQTNIFWAAEFGLKLIPNPYCFLNCLSDSSFVDVFGWSHNSQCSYYDLMYDQLSTAENRKFEYQSTFISDDNSFSFITMTFNQFEKTRFSKHRSINHRSDRAAAEEEYIVSSLTRKLNITSTKASTSAVRKMVGSQRTNVGDITLQHILDYINPFSTHKQRSIRVKTEYP